MASSAAPTVRPVQDLREARELCRLLRPADPAGEERLWNGLASRPDGWRFGRIACAADGTPLSGAILLVKPGNSATLLVPRAPAAGGAVQPLHRSTALAVAAAIEAFRTAAPTGVVVALTEDDDGPEARCLAMAGLERLTQLQFHERLITTRDRWPSGPATSSATIAPLPQDLPLIAEALAATYVGSRDCPELTDRRPAGEILTGHLEGSLRVPSSWLGAWLGGALVGVSLVRRPEGRGNPAGDADLTYLGVVPAHRGCGIGGALLRASIADASRTGASRMHLACDERNDAALNLYARHGFRLASHRVAWLDPRVGVVVHKL